MSRDFVADIQMGICNNNCNFFRKEWASLGNMEKEEAMLEFVKLLNKCCSLFAPFIASHKIEKEEQERKRSDLQIQMIDFSFNDFIFSLCSCPTRLN